MEEKLTTKTTGGLFGGIGQLLGSIIQNVGSTVQALAPAGLEAYKLKLQSDSSTPAPAPSPVVAAASPVKPWMIWTGLGLVALIAIGLFRRR